MLTVFVAASAGCSIAPPAEMPPFRDERAVVRYDLRDGVRSIRLPASDDSLTLHDLVLEPSGLVPVHRDGERWLFPPIDVDHVLVRANYRVWPRADGRLRDAAQIFPDADELTVTPSDRVPR